MLRDLCWIAPVLLLVLLMFWGVDVVRGGSSIPFWMVVSGWVFFTVALGPIGWVRGLPPGTPGLWRALGLSLLWAFGCLTLLGIACGIVAWIFGPL